KNEPKIKVETKETELIISREFDAPRELAFAAFSSCEHLKRWWGPKEWPMKECKLDFKVGGRWHYCLRGPKEGDESWGVGIYREIEKPDKIVWEDYFSDKDGNISEGMPGGIMTAEFIEKNGKTTIISHSKYSEKSDLDKVLEMGMVEGLTSSQDRLEEYLLSVKK
ncbi:MAG: SRPBCC domain-containing protein, partial [Balneolaceae bacterium]